MVRLWEYRFHCHSYKRKGVIDMKLDAELILKIHVQCSEALDVKDDGSGFLRVIPITGGTFEGKLQGTVIPGGADWNVQRKNGIAHVYAKYLLRTEEGVYIAIENTGKITDNEAAIKTVPVFCVDEDSRYAFLNSGVYVGSLEAGSEQGQVEIIVYKMK